MKFYSIIFIFLSFLSLQSCKTTKEFSEMTKEDVLIKMKTGACFGSCPLFTLTIYNGGYAHFHGKRFTTKDGKWLKKLNKETFNGLIAAFDASNFQNFKYEYPSELADLPMISISYKNKMSRGKDGRPATLVSLQKLLDKIANSKDGWTQLEASKKNDSSSRVEGLDRKTPQYNYSEIIIEPKKGYPMSKLISNYRDEFGLRLLKKIAPNSNLWLVTFNQSKTEPKALMKLLKRDKGIKDVSFNTIISDR